MVAKTLLILSFGAIATYAGRQSAEHRRAQRSAESMALQLSALPHYTEKLSTPERSDTLLMNHADKLFGVSPAGVKLGRTGKDQGVDEPVITAVQLAETLIAVIRKSDGK